MPMGSAHPSAATACSSCVRPEGEGDYVVTRDMKGFWESGIPHGTASQFMEHVKVTLNIEYDINDF